MGRGRGNPVRQPVRVASELVGKATLLLNFGGGRLLYGVNAVRRARKRRICVAYNPRRQYQAFFCAIHIIIDYQYDGSDRCSSDYLTQLRKARSFL